MIESVDFMIVSGMILMMLLVFGATLRLTRFVTTDTLGQWVLRGVAERWASRRENARRTAMLEVLGDLPPHVDGSTSEVVRRWETQLSEDEPVSWQGRLVSGLACPFCVGFWIGLALITVSVFVVSSGVDALMWSWVVLLGSLALNYVVGHISARIDGSSE